MGTEENYAALERHLNEHGNYLKIWYEGELSGKRVVAFDRAPIDSYIKGTITLHNGNSFEVYYRQATQEEKINNTELPEGNDITMAEYYERFIVGKTILHIHIDYDLDDFLYCYAYVTHPANDEFRIQIPIVSVEDIYAVEKKAEVQK